MGAIRRIEIVFAKSIEIRASSTEFVLFTAFDRDTNFGEMELKMRVMWVFLRFHGDAKTYW